MNKAKILVADDIKQNVKLLRVILTASGFDVVEAYDGEEALEKAKSENPDLILLDIMMPKLTGYEVCQKLRANGTTKNIPIVMITALHEMDDRIKGIDAGADDFISKPFNKTELLARVRAVLRRAEATEVGQGRFFVHNDLKIDFAKAEVWCGEQPVYLSATEYRLLLQFTHNIGRIIAAEELLNGVWGPEYRSDKEILWVTIARLRQKVEANPHDPKHIVTRSGLGYFMPPEGE